MRARPKTEDRREVGGRRTRSAREKEEASSPSSSRFFVASPARFPFTPAIQSTLDQYLGGDDDDDGKLPQG